MQLLAILYIHIPDPLPQVEVATDYFSLQAIRTNFRLN